MSKLDIEGLDGFQILKGLILINFHVEEHNSPTHPFKKQKCCGSSYTNYTKMFTYAGE